MKTYIICKENRVGNLDFYMNGGNRSYYLFSKEYKKSVYEFFSKGLPLDDALNFSRARRNKDVIHIIERLPSYIKYVEKVEEISVLRNTIRKNSFKIS